MRHRGRLFVLSGPSGVGKGTLRTQALKGIEGLAYSVSCTTRSPRPEDREGVDYRFVSEDEFTRMAEQGLFLEHARVHGGPRYGTLREDVERELDAGHDVLLEIDVQGALQVRSLVPDSVMIFVLPPSEAELERRLRGRHTETESELRSRLESAKRELQQAEKYDHVLMNDDLDRASEGLRRIILSYREGGLRK
ncbi:MAG: guanylate kinase [Fretibacterium sp.]|uniref:guanylate kinase n=1 Tax=Fretibacterium sp. OH1220_COT-178 TaxID=2491047 RepID=UPI000F5F7037|nr:guanylate kinase [Fretibacterium sp. OH1220_COT-178]MDO4786509.1 guanylate kinase [Fretibacterium sp.]RRD65642.1 guanylate kinase [Fretibacterium sp. OH1220_COT-178]